MHLTRMKGLEVSLREHSGMAGWAVVGATILAVETLSPETLSTASDRMLRGEYGKWTQRAWQVGAGVLFLHTMNLLPERIDPIHQIAGRAVTKLGLDRLSL